MTIINAVVMIIIFVEVMSVFCTDGGIRCSCDYNAFRDECT